MSQQRIHCSFAILLVFWTISRAEDDQTAALSRTLMSRPYLRCERPPCQNYAINHFAKYPEHSWVSRTIGSQQGVSFGVERPRALWSPLGDYIMTGYDLFYWRERRQPEQRFGSELFKDWGAWSQIFNHAVVASELATTD